MDDIYTIMNMLRKCSVEHPIMLGHKIDSYLMI